MKRLHFKQVIIVNIRPSDLLLKNILKTTPFMDIRKKIWIKLGNIAEEGAYINNSLNLIDTSELPVNVILRKRVATAPGVTFITSSSPNDSILAKNPNTIHFCKNGTIEIGEDSWIGANCVIQPGVKIGKCCIIGSMSNVTKDIPDYSLAYGNPAKVIRTIEI